MVFPALDVQQTIYQLLLHDRALNSIIAGRLFDHVPQEPGPDVFPFVHLGDDTWGDWGDKTDFGFEGQLQIHQWSRTRSNEEVKKMQVAIVELIHQKQLNLKTGSIYLARFSYSTVSLDPDGLTRHGVLRFHVLTTEVDP